MLNTNKDRGFLTLSKYSSGLKWSGGILGVVGMGYSFSKAYQGFTTNNSLMFYENSLDFIMGGVGFIPGWGWAASGVYFLIAKSIYFHYISTEEKP